MNYKKLHEDTINRLQQMVSCGKITVEVARGICADFIPESEDEKIRKELIEFFNQFENGELRGVDITPWIAWLKKQGEQKPEINDDVLSRFAFYQYDDDAIYLSSLFVRESDRGRGYGSKVLKAAEEVAKIFGISKIRLKVERNTWMEEWYKKNGYEYISFEDKYDWFEKRCEQKFVDKCKDCNNVKGCITCTDGDQYAHITEQKPTDKIEPKFKVGDSIKTANEEPLTITEITDNGYWSEDLFICNFDDADKWELVEKKIETIEIPFGAKDSELMGATYYIPEGFHAEIDGNKVIIKQGEQKPADEVKPKFKVGDWITNGINVNKIIGIDLEDEEYLFENDRKSDISLVESISHIWTIQDAKDGDVLCANQIIILFKQWEPDTNCNFVIAHAGIDISGKLQITNGHWLISNESKPATQEQRNLLFTKMREAGYEWDAEKKEVRKIEQKPAWSEEDEQILQILEGIVKDYWAKAEEKNNEIKIREASDALFFLKTIQKSHLHWIKCSDSLPNRDGVYLVVTDGLHNEVYDMARYDSVEGWHKASEILYWMPIPQLNDKSIIKHNLVENVKSKPTWSEEDEEMLQKALSTIRYALSIPIDKENDPCFAGSSTISWLKSIKEKMKGK